MYLPFFYSQDKLYYKESVTEGFDQVVNAFLGIYKGENIGKAMVKV